MLYLLFAIVVAVVALVAWRAVRAQAGRPNSRVIGPDDDPDFLRRLGRGEK